MKETYMRAPPREKPIIMSGNHPKLILDGLKTMTRRVIKLKGYSKEIWDSCVPHNGEQAILLGEPYLKVPYDPVTDNAGNRILCPYGQVGDRLWVRETWRILDDTMRLDDEVRVEYKVGGQIIKYRYRDIYYNESGIRLPVIESSMKSGKWKPAHHLPHIISRITLEITDIRVERVQEITLVDIYREGIENNPMTHWTSHQRKFADLWDSINAKRGYSWEVNPWVWVISFKKIDGVVE